MCRAGGRRCPSSQEHRPSRSKFARETRAVAPKVAESFLPRAHYDGGPDTTADAAYIARTGTAAVKYGVVPFEAMPSEIRGPLLTAAQTAARIVGQHEGSLEKFTGKRLRERTVKQIERDAAVRNGGAVSPVAGESVLTGVLDEVQKNRDVHATIENIVTGASPRSAMGAIDPEKLPQVSEAAVAASDRIDREKLRVWKEMRAKLERDMPHLTDTDREKIMSKIGLREPVGVSSEFDDLRKKYEELDRRYTYAVMTRLDSDRRYLDHQVSSALERDDCYMGLRYAESAYSRSDDPSPKDLKLAQKVADEVADANKRRVEELRGVIASFLPPRATVKSVIAKGPEAYRPETPDQDATLFSLLTAEHGARDMALSAGAVSRKLQARLLGV